MTSATVPARTGQATALAVDRAEIDRRHAAIRKVMAEDGIDVFLIYSSPLRNYDVHFAANYDLIGRGALVVLPLDGEPVLYVGEEWDLERARRVSPLGDVRYEPDLAALCGSLLKTKNSAMTALEWAGSTFAAEVKAAAGGAVRDASPTLERSATRKTPVEQALIREAAALADTSFLYAFDKLTEGMPEFELQAEMEYAMRKGGAVDNFGLFTSGKHNRAIGLVTDKPIENGDLLIFEITPARLSRNYSAQLCRTMSMGAARPAVVEKFNILTEALEAGLAIVKPGTLVCDLVSAQDEVISRYGFAEYCKPPYMRARGHGFGIGRTDLAPKNKRPLEAGMAMIVHPNQYFPDVGYLALGEMIIVTETGYERLCVLDRKVYQKV
jgi:Xaa-Pro aminopeptidase